MRIYGRRWSDSLYVARIQISISASGTDFKRAEEGRRKGRRGLAAPTIVGKYKIQRPFSSKSKLPSKHLTPRYGTKLLAIWHGGPVLNNGSVLITTTNNHKSMLTVCSP